MTIETKIQTIFLILILLVECFRGYVEYKNVILKKDLKEVMERVEKQSIQLQELQREMKREL